MIFSLLPVTALNVFGAPPPTHIVIPAPSMGDGWGDVVLTTPSMLRISVTNATSTLVPHVAGRTIPVRVGGAETLNAIVSHAAVTANGFTVDLGLPSWPSGVSSQAGLWVDFTALQFTRTTASVSNVITAEVISNNTPFAAVVTPVVTATIPEGVGELALDTAEPFTVTIPAGNLDSLNRLALGDPNTGAYLQIALTGASFENAQITGGAITVVGHTPPMSVPFTLTPGIVPGIYNLNVNGRHDIPAGYALSFRIYNAGVVLGGGSYEVRFITPGWAPSPPIAQGTIRRAITPGETPPPPGNVLTIHPDAVLNAREPSTAPDYFLVAVNMSELQTNFAANQTAHAARMEFVISGATWAHPNDLTNDAYTARGAAARIPRISVHPSSEIWLNHVRQPNPTALFGRNANSIIPAELDVVRHSATRVEAWLNFDIGGTITGSQQFVQPNMPTPIQGLTGTLVLQIENVRANDPNARMTVNRIGRFGAEEQDETRVPLVRNRLLTFGTLNYGVDFTATARYFSNALAVPRITVTERRPGSILAPDPGQAGRTRNYVRLMGPRDYAWSVGATWADAGAAWQGLQPLGRLEFTQAAPAVWNTIAAPTANPTDAVPRPAGWGIADSFIDGATGRPVIVLYVDMPARLPHPHTDIRGALQIDGLALVPTRENVPSGQIEIRADLVNWGGADTTVSGITFTPIVRQDIVQVTGHEMGALIALGRNRANQNWSMPSSVESLTTLVNSLRTGPSVNRTFFEVGDAVTWFGGRNLNVIAGSYTPWIPETGTGTVGVDHLNWRLTQLVIGTGLVGAALSWGTEGGTVVTEIDRWQTRTWQTAAVNWITDPLLIGHRTDATLELSAADSVELISGQRGFPLASWNIGTGVNDTPSTSNTANNLREPYRVARVTLQELAPGALDTGWNNSMVTFHLDNPEGVQFTHAVWRLHDGPNLAGVRIPWTHVQLQTDDTPPAVQAPGVAILNSDNLRVFVPRSINPAAIRNLDVYFFVSIEAGYEARIGDDISISVSGDAINAIPVAADRQVYVASVVDPISVELIGGPIGIGVGQVMLPTEVTPIGDIVITEREFGTLPRGTVLRLGIEADPIPVLGNHGLLHSVVSTDSYSGIDARVTFVTVGQNAFVDVEIIRESVRGQGVITLTNNHVIGTFHQAIRYGISVNATPIATNEGPGSVVSTAPGNIGRNPIAQNTARGIRGIGLFDNIPYFVEVVRFEDFVYEGLPPGIGVPGPGIGITPGQNFRFWEGMGAMPTNVDGDFQVVEEPFILYQTTPEWRVSMINPRAFAHLIGGSINWNEATQTVTLTGPDANGVNDVTVVLTVNSNQAMVNGNNVDIATFATESGPAGSVSTLNIGDRTFIPLRFIANAFGYQVDPSGFPVIELR